MINGKKYIESFSKIALLFITAQFNIPGMSLKRTGSATKMTTSLMMIPSQFFRSDFAPFLSPCKMEQRANWIMKSDKPKIE